MCLPKPAAFYSAGLLSLFRRHLLVVELHVGSMIETAMVGRDGAFNAAAAWSSKVSLNKGIVQNGRAAPAP